MKDIVDEILKLRQLSEEFYGHEFYYLKVQAPRPNALEIRKRKDCVRVAEVSNSDYSFITGDLVASPEMEFEILENNLWVPTFLREGSQPGKKSVEYIDGCRVVREIRQRNQRKFEKAWAEKLRARDYVLGCLRTACGLDPDDFADKSANLNKVDHDDF